MVSPGASQTLTFTAASNSQPSVQQISFQATSGGLVHSSSSSLSIAHPVYAYIANGLPGNSPNNIVGYAVDANTGNLTALSTSPTSLSNLANDIVAVSEAGGGAFVYVLTSDQTSQGARTLSTFKVDAATGTLTLAQTINYQPGGDQWYMSVHPSGRFLYVSQANCTLAYTIDPATGNLTQSSCSGLSYGQAPGFSPSGNFAYQQIKTETDVFFVRQSDGSLTCFKPSNRRMNLSA